MQPAVFYRVLDCRMPLWQKVALNLVSYSLLALCIYLSRDSAMWSGFTMVMLAFGLYGLTQAVFSSKRVHEFRDVRALQQWADSLVPRDHWQPMETAPRDGYRFLAYGHRTDEPQGTNLYVEIVCYVFEDFYTDDGVTFVAKKWAALPKVIP